MPQLDALAQRRLKDIEKAQLKRVIRASKRSVGAAIEIKGKPYISFSCNDYLGLSHHPQVTKAAQEALNNYGVGAGASRLVTGNHLLYTELEKLIAQKKGAEAATVFGSGYLANISLIPALCGKEDLILADKLVHACIIDGIRLSGAKFYRFSHNSLEALEKQLQQKRKEFRQCFIITETVFSMDGDLAPVKQMRALAEKYDATLITDDAHGFGVIEPKARAHVQMGTLSKAVGSYGGYVAASRSVIELITNTARGLIFSTALPPAVVAASIQAIKNFSPALSKKALNNAQHFARSFGLNTESTIVPLILKSEKKALDAAAKLQKHGFWVQAIRPPAVPENTARLRFTFSSEHKKEDILRLVQVIKKEGIA